MKVEKACNPRELFTPQSCTVTVETQKEADALKRFFNEVCLEDIGSLTASEGAVIASLVEDIADACGCS